jgi:hypothetical protein
VASRNRAQLRGPIANADRVVAWSHYGELYVSEDAGASWRKVAREFTDVRTVARLSN